MNEIERKQRIDALFTRRGFDEARVNTQRTGRVYKAAARSKDAAYKFLVRRSATSKGL